MVLEHLKNNLHFSFNGSEEVSLGHGVVKLGHETKVVFEVVGIPVDINTVLVKNTAFKDIHKNQSVLVLLKEGFDQEHFVLNNANNHTLALKVNGNEFGEAGKSKTNFFSSYLGLVFIGILGFGYTVYYVFKNKKMDFYIVR